MELAANHRPNATSECFVDSFEMARMAMSSVSVDRHIEAIVERRAEQRPHGVAKLPRIGGAFVGVERLAGAPGRQAGGGALGRLGRFHHIVAEIDFALPR